MKNQCLALNLLDAPKNTIWLFPFSDVRNASVSELGKTLHCLRVSVANVEPKCTAQHRWHTLDDLGAGVVGGPAARLQHVGVGHHGGHSEVRHLQAAVLVHEDASGPLPKKYIFFEGKGTRRPAAAPPFSGFISQLPRPSIQEQQNK